MLQKKERLNQIVMNCNVIEIKKHLLISIIDKVGFS